MIVVDQKGRQRIAIVGRVKIESRPLVLVEAKVCVFIFGEIDWKKFLLDFSSIMSFLRYSTVTVEYHAKP